MTSNFLLNSDMPLLSHYMIRIHAKLGSHLRKCTLICVKGKGETTLKITLSTPNRDSNQNFPIISSLIYCESDALYHVASEAGEFLSQINIRLKTNLRSRISRPSLQGILGSPVKTTLKDMESALRAENKAIITSFVEKLRSKYKTDEKLIWIYYYFKNVDDSFFGQLNRFDFGSDLGYVKAVFSQALVHSIQDEQLSSAFQKYLDKFPRGIDYDDVPVQRFNNFDQLDLKIMLDAIEMISQYNKDLNSAVENILNWFDQNFVPETHMITFEMKIVYRNKSDFLRDFFKHLISLDSVSSEIKKDLYKVLPFVTLADKIRDKDRYY
uniref:(California timema) hypothetical protein n=1 Tax=Timema californicum TaxID=61474 RepID=A0A7R9J9F7_TIMCA|nr:unnamed protein product [Timema californicum]